MMAEENLFLNPDPVLQIHKSYCTEVLQSANILNWHNLVYTLLFS